MSGYFWVVLGILLVSTTKYLTSVRLRGLAEKVQSEHKDADDLRHVLVQHSERETLLKTETGRLEAKLTALRNVVINIERQLQRHSRDDTGSRHRCWSGGDRVSVAMYLRRVGWQTVKGSANAP